MKRILTIAIGLASTTFAAESTKFEWFHQPLMEHGSWLADANHGRVWQPKAAKSTTWRPYNRGQWVYTNHGWAWNSNEPFGGITYHYGRWALTPNSGWVWVPGKQWAPSWVSWRIGADFVGWAPLPPKSMEFPDYSWGSNVDALLSIGPEHYSFLKTTDFSNFSESTFVPAKNNLNCIHQTSNVTDIRVFANNITSGGPSLDQINRILEVDMPIYQLDKQQSQQRQRLVTSWPTIPESPPATEQAITPEELSNFKELSKLKAELSVLKEQVNEPVSHTRVTIYERPPIIYSGYPCNTYSKSITYSRTLRPHVAREFLRPTLICHPDIRRHQGHAQHHGHSRHQNQHTNRIHR